MLIDRVLDTDNAIDANGTNIKIFTNNGNDAQLYRIIPSATGYRISPKISTTRVLDVYNGSTENNANIQLYQYGGVTQQQWIFESNDEYGSLGWSYVFSNASEYSRISSGYKTPSRTDHKGIDIIGKTTGISGVAIRSPYSGTVQLATWNDSAGNYIVIRTNSIDSTTGNYIRVGYMHMQSASPLSVNDTVSVGTIVGYVGSTGDSTGPHLHLCMWNTTGDWATMSNTINPQRFFPTVPFTGDLSNVRP